jgi:hypothetical protein
MIVTLALLASTNTDCARALYHILDVDICEAIDRMKATAHLDEKIADEFLLMLTMVKLELLFFIINKTIFYLSFNLY